MNTFALKISGLVALVFLVTPAGAQAYRFVDSSSVQLTPDTYLLTHTYSAGFLNTDANYPIVATQDDASEGDYPRVGFSVEGDEVALQGAEVNALVLSDAPIVDNQYQTAAGDRTTFVLFTLVTLQNPAPASDNISLAFRFLPYSYMRDGEVRTGAYAIEGATEIETDALMINPGK